MGAHADLRGVHLEGLVGGQREGRRAKRHGVEAEQQVVHDRVADDRQLDDVAGGHACPGRQRGHQLADRGAHGAGHGGRPVRVQHGVRDAAHEVLAEADLRIHHALGREHGAIRQVDEVAGEGRRADVEGDAQGVLVEAGPDGRDDARLVDRDGHAVRARLQRGRQGADDLEVRRETGEAPFGGQGVLQAGQVAARRGEHGRRHLDVVEARDGVDLEGPAGQLLAHDLPVHLALRRDVDHDVAAQGRGAGQAPPGRQAVGAGVRGLDVARRREVIGRRGEPQLGELAQAGLDLAASAQAAPAAHRVDVHPQRAARVQDGRTRLEAAAPAGWREHDHRLRRAAHGRDRLSLSPRRRRPAAPGGG